MGWLHEAFKRNSYDDNDDRSTWYSLKPRFFSSRRNRNARKIRHVTRNQVDVWRSSSHLELPRDSSPSALPLPLPLPEFHVLLRDDPKSASTHTYSVPLPSPDTTQNRKRGSDDKDRERDGERQTPEALNTDVIDGPLTRLVGQDTRTNVDKSTKNQGGKGISSRSYHINIPTSAPASPYTSPVLSPPSSDMSAAHNYTNRSNVFRVWSEPEMSPTDDNVGLGLYKRMPSDKIISSFDNSPIESPGAGCGLYAASPPMPASPLPKMPPEMTPVALPLPLPPGAGIPPQPTSTSPIPSTSPPQPSSLPQVAAKPEVTPVQSPWSKGKLIGRGTFGSVYVASNRETGALCAMKEVEILPDDSKSAECMRQLEQEIKVLSNLKHPNIVQYYGSEIIGDKFYIYLEYVHPGSINKFINDHCGAITESVVRNFTRHILSGLAYLHSTKTIHRDIKGANLLVDAYGVVKLADFGMAKHLNGQTANLSLKGSPYWLAPELLQCVMQNDGSADAALAVDIWSLGCTIIEMMKGKPPWSEYEGAAALFKVIQETPPIPETMSAEGKDFLKCCFRRNPGERPTANELLDHPFVSNSQQGYDFTLGN